jgi:CheY-like chemotaxis protein
LHLGGALQPHAVSSRRRPIVEMSKVMVVDDAYSEVQVMESILKSAGHQVVSYTDGTEIEQRIVAEKPDVVLLDIVMPNRNGFEILRTLRRDERTKQTRIVVVSSKNQQADRAWGLKQGADEYVGKPFTPEQLLAVVQRFSR